MIKNSIFIFIAMFAVVLDGACRLFLTVFVICWAIGVPIEVETRGRKGHIKWFTFYPNPNDKSTGRMPEV